jgi:predicted transcriptional regulator
MQKSKVSDCMHRSVITVDADDTLVNVAKVLRVAAVSGVPVLDKGDLPLPLPPPLPLFFSSYFPLIH